MIERLVSDLARQGPATRRAIRRAVFDLGNEPAHADAVATVANELLVAAFEQRVTTPMVVTIEAFALLTSVRLRCDAAIELRDERSDLRERVLSALTIAFGRRVTGSGSELWAEVPRPQHRP
jgi:hypothetical protein